MQADGQLAWFGRVCLAGKNTNWQARHGAFI